MAVVQSGPLTWLCPTRPVRPSVRPDRRERRLLDGPLRVPGQAVLRPLRHPGEPRWPRRTPSTRRSPQADAAGYPVVVKAQVQVGGRGKAGGIKLANDADEVRLHAGNILGMDIKGHVVKRVWIEHASDIAEEYYASFTLDRAAKKHLLMLSAPGRRGDRGGRREGPRRDRQAAHRPGRRARPRHRPPGGASTPRSPTGRSTAPPTSSSSSTTASPTATATSPRSTR